ncbi:hypothetical protein BGX27_005753 [Mortierella sp. AM989]|nr:hypothetical protein BGX27_005753 [Mortierella sp. AM989]
MHGYAILSLLGMLIVLAFWLGDYKMLWNSKAEVVEVYWVGLRDYYFWGLFISPSIISHFVTIWGHYYRADSIFQQSISRVSWPTSLSAEERSSKRLNMISIWERHDAWFGYTVKYWVLLFIATFVNLVWFIQPIAINIKKALENEEESSLVVWGAYIGYGSGYAAMGACGMILLLVLRRSMFHALGFTYADLLPLHRGMGYAIVFWSVVHTIGYMIHIIAEGELAEEINFDGETRGPQNILGFVALAALLALWVLSLAAVRRRFYVLFLVSHRYLSVITFAGTLMHYPYFMTWYYVIPSMCLFLADRFVPKIVQSFSVAPTVICSFNKDVEILTVVITSRDRLEPLKPYYPGDYISLQLKSLSEIYHPFTIASYWAEDPYSMTLYIRTFGDNKNSWTSALSDLCNKNGDPVMLQMNVEGVFGDRLHDYLCSDVIVIFAAGAAITTFMPLIKSIAAHIEANALSVEPQSTIKIHLICTFRYENELYAYGDFLYQITHDHRFTSWLRTDIHVSRPGKTFIVSTDVTSNAEHSKTTIPLNLKAQVDSDTPMPIEQVQPVSQDHMAVSGSRIEKVMYTDKPLPTFLASNSTSVSTIHAKRDLLITAVLLLIPFAAFIGLRYVGLEGAWNGEHRWCRTTRIYDQNMTNKCMWNYTMTPGTLHIVIASLIGYILIFVARRSSRRASSEHSTNHSGSESGIMNNQSTYLKSVLVNQLMTPDGSIRFKPLRLDVEKCIKDLIAEDIGVVPGTKYGKMAAKTTSVFVGGPDGFLDSVEKCSKEANWTVEFHRETWSP